MADGALDFIMPHGYQLNPDGSMPDIMRDRLYLARKLFEDGYASSIIISGRHGKLNGQARRTEAEVMLEYFLSHRIPESSIVGSPVGDNTFECLQYAHGIVLEKGWTSGIMVSNEEHLGRIRRISTMLFSRGTLLVYKGISIQAPSARESFLQHERSALEELARRDH